MNRKTPMRYVHVSNALTYASLLAGLLAVISAKEFSSWHISGALIVASVLLDTFDGRFARLFPRSDDQKEFGMQLDSLVDAVVFGFVPVACTYLLLDFGPFTIMRLMWLGVALVYLVSAITRLGCYNLHQANETHFVGMPTTLAALVITTLFLVSTSPALSGLALGICALVMVAPLSVPKPRGLALAVFVIWIALVLSLHLRAAGMELTWGSEKHLYPTYAADSRRFGPAKPLPHQSQNSTGVQR